MFWKRAQIWGIWGIVMLTNYCLATMPEPEEYILDFPRQNNPLNMSVAAEKNYFMIIGDWGAKSASDMAVQGAIAEKMISLYEKRKSQGYNLLFIATVGDNFYYTGLKCDSWVKRWYRKYGQLATDYPWLAVFGNHDWGTHDRNALCAWGAKRIKYIDPKTNIPYAAHQINDNKKGCVAPNYYLPDFGYYYRIDQLSFEVIFLEESQIVCPEDLQPETILQCDNSSTVACEYLGKMKSASENMLVERAQTSNNSNFLIIQHYPEMGSTVRQLFIKNRKNETNETNEEIWSAYGHVHIQECDNYDSKSNKTICNEILTGGGGGCCDEQTLRGFFVVDFDDTSGKMTQPFSIDDSTISCQYPCNSTSNLTQKQIMQSQFEHCCFAYQDPFDEQHESKCQNFDLNACGYDH